ncbi:MAG: sugar ABC transporter substrate-binding protein [Velocimicrobium sp.]
MKKRLSVLLCAAMVATMLVGCGNKTTPDTSSDDKAKTEESSTDATPAADASTSSLSGKKVAVVRNLANGDHTQQYLAGCVEEGEKMGMTVDTFVTDGDDAKCQETVAQVISKDYDAIVVSHGQLSYSYNMLLPAIEKGMKVVTFDTMPYENGDASGKLLEGVTSTSQDDYALAELSLGYMMKEFEENGGTYPMKVLKTFMGPGIPPLDRRNEIYTKLEEEGKIETVQVIAPSDSANARGDMTTKTEAILPTISAGSVDAIWGCYDELAKGVLQALNDAKRTDIPMYTIDVSNDDIQLMVTNADVWKSTAAVDPKLIGTVDMRLIALKLVGEDTPDYFSLTANNILTSQLSEGTTMQELGTIVDGWGDATDPEGALYTDTITNLYVK